MPDIENNPNGYEIDLFGPLGPSGPDGPVAFGLTGPRGKYCVMQDFLHTFHVQASQYINIIHPTAYMASSASIQTGILIEPGAIISSQVRIGFGVTIKRGVSIGHHNVIGDYTEINSGVTTAGKVVIGRGCIIGTGAVFKELVTIGENTLVGRVVWLSGISLQASLPVAIPAK